MKMVAIKRYYHYINVLMLMITDRKGKVMFSHVFVHNRPHGYWFILILVTARSVRIPLECFLVENSILSAQVQFIAILDIKICFLSTLELCFYLDNGMNSSVSL